MRASSALMGLSARNRFEEDATSNMAYDVMAGLRAQQKYIPSKYLYVARGSRLFELICNLPEYYPTRIELRLLCTHAKDIVRGFGDGDLVELGQRQIGHELPGSASVERLVNAAVVAKHVRLKMAP